jgi:hypothetical protein
MDSDLSKMAVMNVDEGEEIVGGWVSPAATLSFPILMVIHNSRPSASSRKQRQPPEVDSSIGDGEAV